MNTKPDSTTPEDFPRDYGQGAVGGVQPKLLVRKNGKTYVHGLTGEERYARYDNCFDMVNQLAKYCRRKILERPEWSPKELLEKVRTSVESRADWDFSSGEVDWMMMTLCTRMQWTPGGDSSKQD
jgi:hypothetical protein